MSTSRRQIIAPAKRDYRKIIIYSTLAVLAAGLVPAKRKARSRAAIESRTRS